MRLLLLVLVTFAGAAEPAFATCTMAWHSTIPILMQRGQPTIPAEINDTVVGLIVDTGSSATTVTPETARQVGLRPIKGYERRMSVTGVGGGAFYEVDVVQALRLGGVTYRNVGVLESDINGLSHWKQPVAGLIGSDLMAHYDVALDEPGETLGLYTAPDGCGRITPTLPGDWHPVDIVVGDDNRLVTSVMANGRPVRVLVDSGAGGAMLDEATAARIGVSTGGKTVPFGGIGEQAGTARLQTIATLSLAGVTLQNMPVLVTPSLTGLPYGAEMLLGSALLQRVPVVISYRSHTLWVAQPAGKEGK